MKNVKRKVKNIGKLHSFIRFIPSLKKRFWEYDSGLARRWELDPRPNVSISGYAVFGGNPIVNVDVLGDTTAVFGPSGEFMHFENDGYSSYTIKHFSKIKVVECNFLGASFKVTEFVSPKYYVPSDGPADFQDIRGKIIKNLVLVSKPKVVDMLKEAGAFDPKNRQYAPDYLLQESHNGELDFSHVAILNNFEKLGAVGSPLSEKASCLFIVEGSNLAYNQSNFGNFLWGASAHSLGIPSSIAKMAAHVNSKFFENGYKDKNGKPKKEWDSADDQRSIQEGANYSSRNNLRALHVQMQDARVINPVNENFEAEVKLGRQK